MQRRLWKDDGASGRGDAAGGSTAASARRAPCRRRCVNCCVNPKTGSGRRWCPARPPSSATRTGTGGSCSAPPGPPQPPAAAPAGRRGRTAATQHAPHSCDHKTRGWQSRVIRVLMREQTMSVRRGRGGACTGYRQSAQSGQCGSDPACGVRLQFVHAANRHSVTLP